MVGSGDALLTLVTEILLRVGKIGFFIAIGMTVANLLIGFDAIEPVGVLARPLTRPANLPEEVGSAMLTTVASTTAGYGMLAEFRDSGVLNNRATLVAVTVNTFFGSIQHIFTFYVPVLIPILGLRVGLMYVGIRILISLAITTTGVVAGAVVLSKQNRNPDALPEVTHTEETDGQKSQNTATARTKIRDAVGSAGEKVQDILPRLLAIYAGVTVLTTYYNLQKLTTVADPPAVLGLPSAAIPVITVFTISTTNGALVIAPLIRQGVFTPLQAVATMLVGSIVSFTVTTFKRSIPFQYGIWGAEFGSKVVAVNTTLKILWLAVALGVLLHAPFI